jgi:molecular chaperone HtpG
MSKHQFQTEVSQLLNLIVHSLYSHKEIFLRELVSNASDALDKLKYLTMTDDAFRDFAFDPRVDIEFDEKDRKTLTVTDTGIGMNEEDLVENLGTIAKSGTKGFLSQLTGDAKKDSNLIGQFGVGFYSSFMVADEVTVLSRRAGQEEGVRWTSRGTDEFTVESVEKATRGTEVTLHLREDEDEFLEAFRLRTIIHKYSDHISLPIQMKSEDADKDEYETVNSASALWARPKSEIGDDEYKEFYKHVAHDFEEPLAWTHNHVEGKQSYTSLLYIPRRAPFDL